MESDQEDTTSQPKIKETIQNDNAQLNISHEDLSDVSDLDSMGIDDTEKESKV